MSHKGHKHSKKKSSRDRGYFPRTTLENIKRTDRYLDPIGLGLPPHEQQIEQKHDQKLTKHRHNKPTKS